MSRITRKQLDYMEQRLNAALGRPLETYINGTAQIGNVHICGVNGGYNIHEMDNESGGVKGLAYGLTAREAYQWFRGALAALLLNSNDHPGF
jgi:hypothetical protein